MNVFGTGKVAKIMGLESRDVLENAIKCGCPHPNLIVSGRRLWCKEDIEKAVVWFQVRRKDLVLDQMIILGNDETEKRPPVAEVLREWVTQ